LAADSNERKRRAAESGEDFDSGKVEPTIYQPTEMSFFSRSPDERAEQARRAAQRVRRRVQGDDDEVPPAPETRERAPAPTPAPAPRSAPQPSRPAPEARSRSSLIDRATSGDIPKPESAPQPPKPSISDRIAASAEHAPRRPTPPPAEPEPAKPQRMARKKVRPAPAAPAPKAPAKPQAEKPTRAASLLERGFEVAEPRQTVAPDRIAPLPQSPPNFRHSLKRDEQSAPIRKSPSNNRGSTAYPASDESEPPVARPKISTKPKKTRRSMSSLITRSTSAAEYAEALAEESAPQKERPATVMRGDGPVAPRTSSLRTAKTRAFAAFEWMIAGRYLRARKKEGFVSVIAGFSLVGIALGVATLIVVMAVMTGFRETLITQIIGGSPHVNVQSQVGAFENFDTVAEQIRGVDGIEYVTPVVQGQVLATGNDRHSGVLVRGMRKADLERLIETAEPEIINGSLAEFTEDNGVALGANLAAKLGLRIGDFITLISPDGDITPFQATPMPRVKDYKVIQTFKLGVQEIDYNVAFMPFAEAQIYFNKQDEADTLDIFVADAENVEKYSDPIFAASRSSISLYNWKNQNGRLIGAINLERQVMFVILTMIILVAALNIISGLVMLVKDKARDVAIMRTMGMARGSILRIFFICGSSIGVIGSLLGVLLGVLFVVNIHTIQGFVEWVTNTRVWDPSVRAGISEIPTKLQFSDVALTLFIALGLSFIATLFPAWKAAKLDPVEALRYE
jgi:lipoprotein-releasing system permease protein